MRARRLGGDGILPLAVLYAYHLAVLALSYGSREAVPENVQEELNRRLAQLQRHDTWDLLFDRESYQALSSLELLDEAFDCGLPE